jgi:hypothetical protein
MITPMPGRHAVYWTDTQCLKMCLEVFEQRIERATVVIMRDQPTRDAPEPVNAVGVGIISRCALESLRLSGRQSVQDMPVRWGHG